MNRFIKQILAFLVLTFVLALGLDTFISFRLSRNDSYIFQPWNGWHNDSEAYDIVISGNSRACVQYDPRVLDTCLSVKSFNIGYDGSCINRQMIKYREFVRKHGNPSVLLQNIDVHTMDITYGYRREQFFPFFITCRSLMKEFDQYEHFSLAEKYIPCYRYFGYKDVLTEAFFSDNTEHYVERSFKGFTPKDEHWDGSSFAGMQSFTCSVDSGMYAEFKSFINEQKNAGTIVILVNAPMYSGVFDICTNLKEMDAMYDELSAELDIPILDYRNLPMCSDTTYFYNAMHLNEMGAEMFSSILSADLKKLLCQE